MSIDYEINALGKTWFSGRTKGLKWKEIKSQAEIHLKIPMHYTCYWKILLWNRPVITGSFIITVLPKKRI